MSVQTFLAFVTRINKIKRKNCGKEAHVIFSQVNSAISLIPECKCGIKGSWKENMQSTNCGLKSHEQKH